MFVCITRISLNRGSVPGGGGGSSLLEASGDVSLDGVGRIFTTGLTIMELHFQQSYLNGVAHFQIFGVRKFFIFMDIYG